MVVHDTADDDSWNKDDDENRDGYNNDHIISAIGIFPQSRWGILLYFLQRQFL